MAGSLTVRGAVSLGARCPGGGESLTTPSWKAGALLLRDSCDAQLAKPPWLLHILKDQTVSQKLKKKHQFLEIKITFLPQPSL